jgi:hypothetical protein
LENNCLKVNLKEVVELSLSAPGKSIEKPEAELKANV